MEISSRTAQVTQPNPITKPHEIKRVAPQIGVVDSVDKLEKEIQAAFSYDKEADSFVIKITDENMPNRQKLVKQIPPEYMLEIAKEIGKTKGSIIDTEV